MRRSPYDGSVPDARSQMIDAAERLAVEGGLGAMSLRDVMAAAGQRNKSAAQYHFGSREGLIAAVVDARMGPINERRMQLLGELPSHPTVREIAEVLVRPLVEAVIGERGSRWAQFLLQGWADPTVQDVVQRSFTGSGYRRVRALLADVGVSSWRTTQAVGLLVITLAGWEAGHRRVVSRSALVSDLVDVTVSVLTTEESS